MDGKKGVKNDDAHAGPAGVSKHCCPSRVYRHYVVDITRSSARDDHQTKPCISGTIALYFIDDYDRFDGGQLFS